MIHNLQYPKMNQDSLLSPLKENLPISYDPFFNPPNLTLAQTHRQATLVGYFSSQQNPQFCPCCDNIINKVPFSICFKDQELLIFGVGYPLYYKLAKYFLFIMLGIFVVSGSAIYFLMTLTCQVNSTCYSLFGIPIINISIAERTNLNKTEFANMATSIIIFFIVIYLKTMITEDIRILTNKKICPSLYTIMLQNVPIVEDKALIDWIQHCFGEKPIQINWAFNVQEMKKAYQQKQNKVIQLNKIRIKSKIITNIDQDKSNPTLNNLKKNQLTNNILLLKCKQLQTHIERCNQILEKYNSNKQCQKIGTVFVSFEKVETVNYILQNYESSFFNSITKNIFSFIKKSRLQFNQKIVIVNKAPAPLQIIWDNLQFSYIRSIMFEILFIGTMLILLFVALKVIYYFMNLRLSYSIQGEKNGHLDLLIKGIFISLIIIIINSFMRFVIQIFTSAKKYHSFTKYQASFSMYYSIFYIINACCLVYMVHQSTRDDTAQLLFADIHLIMIANAFSQPLFKILDPFMWFRVFMRYYVAQLKSEDNPYTQEYVNQLWEGYHISNSDNYQYITRVLFITTWFASVAPVGVLLSIIGVFLDYWISKYLLVRFYKIPENVSEDIALPSTMSLQLLPLVYICGVIQFSYKLSSTTNIFQFFIDFFHYGVTTVVIMLSICGYLIFCKKSNFPDVKRTYSQSKLGFGYNYETTNPITKVRGNIHYLQEVLKFSSDDLQNSRLIENLLQETAKSPLLMRTQKDELNKIKFNLYKRLSEREHHQIQLQQMNLN